MQNELLQSGAIVDLGKSNENLIRYIIFPWSIWPCCDTADSKELLRGSLKKKIGKGRRKK